MKTENRGRAGNGRFPLPGLRKGLSEKFFRKPLTFILIGYIVSYTSNEPINMDAKSERDRTDLISLKKEAQTLTGNFSDGTSIYLQIAEMLENDILRGVLEEEGQAPSTNELARAYSINPATAAKGINLLVDEGILYKRRGIGMFVAKGGRQRIMQKRKDAFFETYVKRLVREARALGITREELAAMLAKAGGEKGGNAE